MNVQVLQKKPRLERTNTHIKITRRAIFPRLLHKWSIAHVSKVIPKPHRPSGCELVPSFLGIEMMRKQVKDLRRINKEKKWPGIEKNRGGGGEQQDASKDEGTLFQAAELSSLLGTHLVERT